MLIILTLLAPWFLGYHALATLFSRYPAAHRPWALLLGVGYFVGIFVFYGVFRVSIHYLAYNSALWLTLIIVAALTILLWLAGRRAKRVQPAPANEPSRGADTQAEKTRSYLYWGFLALCFVHLAFCFIEVFYRPVFPWDAWLNWMYRAKAWYLSGSITAMDPSIQWATAAPSNIYSVAGHHYPVFVPFTALWSGVALGGWVENLVSLPTFACGVALAIAMFGICQSHGLSRTASIMASYLVLSVPLIGAHISLAGQADIWMAGFTGIGFALLLVGLVHRRYLQVCLGVGLLVMGAQVKVEGAVWLLSGLALTAIVLMPKTMSAAALCAVAAAAVGQISGTTMIELPLLGRLGFDEDYLYASVLGRFTLQTFELGSDYLRNFLLGGSWHLLWTAVLVSLAVALFTIRQRSARVILVFAATAVSGQVLIFFFTEQGAWADDWTAINRLPLHFVPALIMALFITVGAVRPSLHSQGTRVHQQIAGFNFRVFAYTALASLIITAGLFTAFLSSHSSGSAGPALARSGTQMRLMVGRGNAPTGSAIVNIDRFDGNIAIASTGPISRSADDSALVHLRASGSNRNEITLFWRDATSNELFSTKEPGIGDVYVDLSSEPGWGGRVSELGVIFYDDGGSITLEEFGAEADSLSVRLRQMVADWRWQSSWDQRSVHWLRGGLGESPAPLPLFIMGWLLIAALLCLLLARRRSNSFAIFAAVALLCWLMLDARWLLNRGAQANLTVHEYAKHDQASLKFGDDVLTQKAVKRATSDMPQATNSPAARLLIGTNSKQDMRFQMLRGKYHALPVPAHVHERDFNSLPFELADRLLVLKQRYSGDGGLETISSDDAIQVAASKGRSARLAWEDEEAYLLVLGGSSK
ncbi:hypothetical protein NOR53_3258 [gamma proteobacterium NOR5-3]|nr:hypothetical protein NOR53_3258 [gamma proteobacterium NOR5-3]